MSASLSKDLIRIRYALESVDEADREAIVRLVEAAACIYGEEAEDIRAFAFPDQGRPIIWREQ